MPSEHRSTTWHRHKREREKLAAELLALNTRMAQTLYHVVDEGAGPSTVMPNNTQDTGKFILIAVCIVVPMEESSCSSSEEEDESVQVFRRGERKRQNVENDCTTTKDQENPFCFTCSFVDQGMSNKLILISL